MWRRQQEGEREENAAHWLRSGKDVPTPNWLAENSFEPLVALKGMDQVRSTTRRQSRTSRTAKWLWLGRGRSMRG